MVCTRMKMAGGVLNTIKQNKMKANLFVNIIMLMFFIGFLVTGLTILGEIIACKFEDSGFTRWWRKHIAGIDSLD